MPDFRAHLEDDVLAWWLANGPDRRFGGVLTCFANSGGALAATDKYTWSQGRWTWLLARLSRAGRHGLLSVDADDLLDQAASTADFLASHALLPGGRTAYVTTRDGTPKPFAPDGDPHASVFADLFAALGFAGLQAELDASGREAARPWGELAEEILVSARDRVAAGTARNEPYPVDPRFRCFAEPMMLLHTAAQVYAATGSARSGEIAVDAVQAAREFATGADVSDLMPKSSGSAGTLLARHRTPGHLLEFLWFLADAAERVPGVVQSPEWTVDAALGALKAGWDTAAGGLLRYVDVEGGAPQGQRIGDRYEDLVVRTWDTKLWWPHAEALYATALLAARHGNAELRAWHDRIRDYTFGTFPEGPGLEWIQIRARDGSPLDEVVALPVKDPFHIARALLLLVELEHEGDKDA